MTDRIDTATERENLEAIYMGQWSFSTIRLLTSMSNQYLIALDVERAENERLRAALSKIAAYQPGTVDAGMSPWTARAAHNHKEMGSD